MSATEKISDDSTGILLEGYAEFYSADLSEKVIRGLTENALKCKYNGGGIPIGYTIDDEQNFKIDPLTAPLILEAFQKYVDGGTIKSVMDFLNERGVTTYVGKALRIDAVKRILKNREYIGEYKYRDVVTPNGMPAIVPLDLFEKTQDRLSKNKKAPARAKAKDEFYLLTTKLFCGNCGVFMVGESGTSRNGSFYQYYKCVNNKNNKGCKKKSVRKEWIENIAIKHTMEMLYDDALISDLVELLYNLERKENTSIPLIKNQIQEVSRSIDNMLNAIQQGVLTTSTKKRLEELEQRKSDLEVSLINEEIEKPFISQDEIRFWLEKFRQTDVSIYEQKQKLVDLFVNAIYIYDDKVTFTFNYKEGIKSISLKELESSSLCAVVAPSKAHKARCTLEKPSVHLAL